MAIYYKNCEVLSSTTTTITFVTAAQTDLNSDGSTAREIVVGLKTSEEAVCNDAVNSCYFTYSSDATPVLSTRTVAYDATEEALVVTFGGSNFGTSGTTKVYFDTIEQTVLSATDTEIKVKVININGKTVSSIKLYSYNGTPEDDNGLLADLDFTDDITLIQSNIFDGSRGGAVIALKVAGLGPNDSSFDVEVEFGTSKKCDTVSIPEYGIVLCEFGVNTIGAVTLKLEVDGTDYAGIDSTTVDYESSWTPVVSSISNSGTTLTLTGSGFSITEFENALVSVNGVSADTVTIDSATQISATFTGGVPLTETGAVPVVAFVTDTFASDYLKLYATVTTSFTNAVTVSGSALSCSYAGGCSLTITNTGGLFSAMQDDYATVTVCGEVCELDSDSSTSTSAVCTLPSVSSIYAEDNLDLSTSETLTGDNFSDTATYLANAFDGDNQVSYSSTAANCYIGTDFGAGKVGYLYQTAFMMNEFDRDLFVDYLYFQGCNVDDDEDYSDCSWTDISQVSHEIHEGYNYITFYDAASADRTAIPHYRLYRYFNSQAGGCNIGEVTFSGIISEPTTTENLECQAQVEYGTTTKTVTGAVVTYRADYTYTVASISPSYGSVIGGDTVTFTMEDASDITASSVTITIDGVECTDVAKSGNDISCTLGARTGLPEHSLSFIVDGSGEVTWGTNDFLYVNLWSEEATWGYELEPIEGESVYIPAGLNLLVDIATTPILNLVLVEGSLIFPSETDTSADAYNRVFEAHIIFVNGGLF